MRWWREARVRVPTSPGGCQHVTLAQCLEAHRELYNAALQERRDGWSHNKTRVFYGEQSAQLSEIRAVCLDQAVWSFSSQQATLRRLAKAFDGFFRRVKRGDSSGYPRFKGKGRFDSVEWPKDGDGARWLPERKRVYLQGVGQVKVHVHRSVAGRVKTIQIKRQGRRWMLVLSCDDVPANPLPATNRHAGIDLGVASFATTSDGSHVDNPRWVRAAQDKLRAAQQRLARAKRASNNRAAKREAVGARHRKIASQRKDFHHKLARRLVESYDMLVVEDLKIANMVRRPKPVPDPDNPGQYLANGVRAKSGLNRSISDAGWGRLIRTVWRAASAPNYGADMRVAMMTREYPPEVYGGAGVHVTELVAQLRRLCAVDVHCIGEPRPDAFAQQPDPRIHGANPALSTLSADLLMANAASAATVVHSHTWYTGLAGHLTALLYDIPHVLTAHSLEPLRPWKAEQLGGGYRVSTWVERTAVLAADAIIAVSAAMREDVLRVYPTLDLSLVHVIRNGVDTNVWHPAGAMETGSVLAELGVDPGRPVVAFVGRITRQKGVAHLVAAAHRFAPDVQLVLCAGAPDTPELAEEVRAGVAALARTRDGVFWIREMLPVGELREILSAATVFVCPSVYEPLGIVNLEAMACATAVVASDVGGIPEAVADGITGSLVRYDPDDPAGFEAGLAEAINELVADPDRAKRYGEAGRQRCIEDFSWAQIAEQTLEIYRKVCA